MSIDRILAAAASQPWAIMPEKLAEIRALLELRGAGDRLDAAEIQARVGRGRTGQSAGRSSGMVAVIPVLGVISQRMSLMTEISGGTSTDFVGLSFRQAIDDPDVRSILLEIDSPGGSTYGLQELADEIHRARDRKPVVAQVNSLAASGGYWIASAAGEIVMTPGGEVGSIGVYGMHDDLTGAMEKAGIRKTYISAGEYKTEGNPFEPLSEDARAYAQQRVNDVYDTFVGNVARGRKTTAARVRAEFGKGRTVGAREALRVGMVDRIGTMQETLQRLAGSAATGAPTRALASGGTEASDFRRQRHEQRLADDMRRRRHRLRMLGG